MSEARANEPAWRERTEADLSALPLHGMGSASLSWWGSLGYMVIEGSGFALAGGVYLYLMLHATEWPTGAAAPDFVPGTWMVALLLLSLWPNHLLTRWARARQLRKVQAGTLGLAGFGTLLLVLRWFEFGALNVSWDSNAYGSVVWFLLGLHTAHLLTDVVEWWVLAALMFTRHADNPRRFGDVLDNAGYWTFVAVSWLGVYACLYLLPRL